MVWSVRSLGLSLYWPGFLGAEERAGLLFEACAVCIRNMQGLYPTPVNQINKTLLSDCFTAVTF